MGANSKKTSSARSMKQIFMAPTVIAVLSVVGLVAALAGDGAADLLSWVALGVPVAIAAWAYGRRQ
ncbi:MAG: hypothetical protein EP335_06560 [Alphaproteobacteria bacterium]|nr:MAG: hypothetical protein EP335_06560 [Alphaproteobacteria bacterium]